MSSASVDVAVIGSCNWDLVATVDKLPRLGETVLAIDVATYMGGKGGNQAVTAARLGCHVAMVGMVGSDREGEQIRRTLAAEGIDVTHVGVAETAMTGRAMVWVDAGAQNSIVVAAGANGLLTPDSLERSLPLIRSARVVLAQLEVPLDAVAAAAQVTEGLFVLNPAPAQVLPASLLDQVDVLIVNEIEFAVVTGGVLRETTREIVDQLGALDVRGDVVVTLGGRGAVVRSEGESHHVSAPEVDVRDTTGAGDCFAGAFAEALSRGESTLRAVRWAVHAAALSVTKAGATTAMPNRHEVADALAKSTPGGEPRLCR